MNKSETPNLILIEQQARQIEEQKGQIIKLSNDYRNALKSFIELSQVIFSVRRNWPLNNSQARYYYSQASAIISKADKECDM
jgi:hypothetical protein